MRHIRSHFTKSSIEGVGTPTKRPLDYYLKSEVKFQHFATRFSNDRYAIIRGSLSLPCHQPFVLHGPYYRPLLLSGPFYKPFLLPRPCYRPFLLYGLYYQPFLLPGPATSLFPRYMGLATGLFCYLGCFLLHMGGPWLSFGCVDLTFLSMDPYLGLYLLLGLH